MRLGADAVSVHVNVGCAARAAAVGRPGHGRRACDGGTCRCWRWSTPAVRRSPTRATPRLVAHAAAVAADLGADLVKTAIPAVAALAAITRRLPDPGAGGRRPARSPMRPRPLAPGAIRCCGPAPRGSPRAAHLRRAAEPGAHDPQDRRPRPRRTAALRVAHEAVLGWTSASAGDLAGAMRDRGGAPGGSTRSSPTTRPISPSLPPTVTESCSCRARPTCPTSSAPVDLVDPRPGRRRPGSPSATRESNSDASSRSPTRPPWTVACASVPGPKPCTVICVPRPDQDPVGDRAGRGGRRQGQHRHRRGRPGRGGRHLRRARTRSGRGT